MADRKSSTEARVTYFGDWRDTRAAIQRAYEDLGEPVPQNIPPRDWNLVDAAIKADREARRSTCQHCKTIIPPGQEIRCLDCKTTLCELCAPIHFWPSGRRLATSAVLGSKLT